MPMECSLLYVSRVQIPLSRLDDEVRAIVSWSDSYNPTVEITGGLVRAQGWFSQLLEGPNAAVETLMHSIGRDPRHTDVTILRASPRYIRRLTRWSLAYAGEWHYMADMIGRLIAPPVSRDQHAVSYLEQTIIDFASVK